VSLGAHVDVRGAVDVIFGEEHSGDAIFVVREEDNMSSVFIRGAAIAKSSTDVQPLAKP
jgi:hypothetical protein